MSDVRSILDLEVPLLVVLGERQMRASEVLSLVPGTIIELPKSADEELELRVSNKPIGTGMAVKVGENFGLRVNFIGDLRARIEALGPDADERAAEESDSPAGLPADARAQDSADVTGEPVASA